MNEWTNKWMNEWIQQQQQQVLLYWTPTWTEEESSILAFSAASLSLWRAIASLERSTPLCHGNKSVITTFVTFSSKFSFCWEVTEFSITVNLYIAVLDWSYKST